MLDVCERVDVDEIDITVCVLVAGSRSGRGLDHAAVADFCTEPNLRSR